MIDGGVILILVSALFAFAGPTEKLVAQRRHYRMVMIEVPPLADAFPFAPPSPATDEIVREAEAALERDDLIRGVRAIGEIYERPFD